MRSRCTAQETSILAGICRGWRRILANRRVPGAAILTCAAALCGLGQSTSREQALEYRVKAAFLLNFTKFIEWPAGELPDSDSFTVCILGEDPFGSALDQVTQGETVSGRKLVIMRARPSAPRSCQVLFVSRTVRDYSPILSSLGRGVLTVGEGDGFLHDGGMIAFVIENRRVRFDIDQSAAVNAGLKISSKLLNVARSVEK